MNIPKNVEIIEVCPRDGFQNVKDFIKTEDKIEIIKKLVDVGYKKIEITSFVNPKWIPQMIDAADVVAEIKNYTKDKDVELMGLIPNKRGATNAEATGIDWISYVVSVSEKHNMANVNRTVEQSMAEFEEIVGDKKGMKVRLGIATALGCPFGEEIKTEKIISMAEKGLKLGADSILIADTVGLGNPVLVDRVLGEMKKYIDMDKICMHLHDTRGLSLAHTLVAMNHGVKVFESAAGGLGGCPFAPGASGNCATEDLANMLMGMRVDINLNIEELNKAIDLIKQKVNSPIVSHMNSLCKK